MHIFQQYLISEFRCFLLTSTLPVAASSPRPPVFFLYTIVCVCHCKYQSVLKEVVTYNPR